MYHMSELIKLSDTIDHTTDTGGEFHRFVFDDGSSFIDARAAGCEPFRLLSDEGDNPIPEPNEGRYPFSDFVAQLIVDHFDATGKPPLYALNRDLASR